MPHSQRQPYAHAVELDDYLREVAEMLHAEPKDEGRTGHTARTVTGTAQAYDSGAQPEVC